MLIMKRRPGEGIAIGDQIKVRVLHAEDGQLYIGVDAPVALGIDALESQAEDAADVAGPVRDQAVNKAA
ncbi:carbon storage regulator [Granulosicoccaceae sp. 1_MG-2023]|nr:carbon storage regulator [Granulosicoccaceae sp. 1_MG-2023]